MSRTVRCVNPDCERSGVTAVIPDTPVARGVVVRPGPLHCAACDWQVADESVRVEAQFKSPPENTARRTGRPKGR